MKSNYQYFLEQNLDAYIGKWIAICDNEIVASGTNVKEVYKEAKSKCPRLRPMVTRVPEKETMIF